MKSIATFGSVLLSVLIVAAGTSLGAETATEADFHVAVAGNDKNPGTADQPFASLERAQKAVRAKIAAGLHDDVTVMIHAGTYTLSQSLTFGPQDSGTEEHAVTYVAASGEPVVISGGRRIRDWQQGEDGGWTAEVSGVREGEWCFRHLFVNGQRATRARIPNAGDEKPRWQLTDASLSEDLSRYTLSIAPERLGDWARGPDLEIMVAGNWAVNRKRVAAVDRASGTITLAPPHASGHNAIRPRAGRWCFFENASGLLDVPGEWYLNRETGVLHYRPRKGEELANAEVIAPAVGRLIEVTGTPDQPVRNLHFKGLSLQYAGWRPPRHGYLGIQACHFTQGRDWKRPWARIPAAVCFNYAEGCGIQNGAVAHVGRCAIELVDGCHDNVVEGNHVYDVSGNGIMLGGPKDEDRVPRDNRIANNLVHDCGVEYHGAVGIWVGFADGARVLHNVVHDLPYSGISIGWQWNPEPTPCKNNVIARNHVYDVMKLLCDGGCIYTLGFQPGTVIRGNHLHDVHRSQFAQGAPNNGMFIDQGSKGYLFERNVIYNTAAELVRFNQCERDWHTWRDNHFGEAADVRESGQEIIEAAGLEPPYRKRLLGQGARAEARR
ncbi:MAG: right-handed parallel beta-helix repeat-containing protein [Planctomycetota bacterium]